MKLMGFTHSHIDAAVTRLNILTTTKRDGWSFSFVTTSLRNHPTEIDGDLWAKRDDSERAMLALDREFSTKAYREFLLQLFLLNPDGQIHTTMLDSPNHTLFDGLGDFLTHADLEIR